MRRGVALSLAVGVVLLLTMAVRMLPAYGQDEPLRIGLVTHEGGEVDDRSFNQSVWEGVLAAAERLDGVADYIETQDSTDYGNNIAEFVEHDYHIIVTVGLAMGEATRQAALLYPDVHFIGADQREFPDSPFPPNMTGLVFHEDQAGYLAGALAGHLTRSDVIAGIYGTDLAPAIVAFATGFENGVQSVNPTARVITTYHPGGFGVAFNDPEWGAATAAQAIDQGADVVFAAGGATGMGALIEVANRTTAESPLYCIGVDTDQWETVPEARDCLVSSAVKHIADGVEAIIVQVVAGEPPQGNFYGPVGLADFHDFEDVVPEAVQEELAQLADALAEGEVDTGYHPGGPAGAEDESEAGEEPDSPTEAPRQGKTPTPEG